MIPDSLEKLGDDDLRAVIGCCEELLSQHDKERKTDALNKARALLESVGLSLKDLDGRGIKKAKRTIYKGGHTYQHPTDKTLLWAAKGKKPHWAIAVEKAGGRLIEVQPANDNNSLPLKKTG